MSNCRPDRACPMVSVAILGVFLLPGCGEPLPTEKRVERPTPPAWVYDGRRLFRVDLDQGTLQQVHLPGNALPLDETTVGDPTGLEPAPWGTQNFRLVPSPDARYLAAVQGSGAGERLYAWDLDRGRELDLGPGPFSDVQFLDAHPDRIVTIRPQGIDLHDLSRGTTRGVALETCETWVGGDRIVVRTPTGDSGCGGPGKFVVIQPGGDGIALRELDLPWDASDVVMDLYRPAAAADGSFLSEAHRRNQPEATARPLVWCTPATASCREVAAQGRVIASMFQGIDTGNVSPDGRTLAWTDWDAESGTRLVVEADGLRQDWTIGTQVQQVQALDGLAGLFALVSTGPVQQPTGFRIVRVDLDEPDLVRVWDREGDPWNPVIFVPAQPLDRMLLVQFLFATGTDMVNWFPVEVRHLDPATGDTFEPLAGAGVPVAWRSDLRGVLIARDRGPGGIDLLYGDPAVGSHTILASWTNRKGRILSVATLADRGATWGLPTCNARPPIEGPASVTVPDAGSAYDLTLEGTLSAIDEPAGGEGPVVWSVLGPDQAVRQVWIELPAPWRLPGAVGGAIQIHAEQTPTSGSPVQVFSLGDAQGKSRALFLSGPGVLDSSYVSGTQCGDQQSCPYAGFGHTGCAPDDIDGCGWVDHPPVVLSDSFTTGWPFQVEPGTEGYNGYMRAVVFATNRLRGSANCPALPADEARLLILWE